MMTKARKRVEKRGRETTTTTINILSSCLSVSCFVRNRKCVDCIFQTNISLHSELYCSWSFASWTSLEESSSVYSNFLAKFVPLCVTNEYCTVAASCIPTVAAAAGRLFCLKRNKHIHTHKSGGTRVEENPSASCFWSLLKGRDYPSSLAW
jgi:hypothetical protein